MVRGGGIKISVKMSSMDGLKPKDHRDTKIGDEKFPFSVLFLTDVNKKGIEINFRAITDKFTEHIEAKTLIDPNSILICRY